MSDVAEYDDSDDYEFSESELDVSNDMDNQQLMNTFKKLGKFTSSKLASGFSENEHQVGFEGLISRLGDFYPIPILEQAVRYYRAKRVIIVKKLIEAMFTNGASKIVFKELGETWTKDYDLSIKVEDKTAFYGWLESHNYGHLIKTEFKFGKEVPKENIKAFQQWLIDQKVPFDKDENIHHMTLKSNMKKLYETGEYLEAQNEGFVTVKPTQTLKLKIDK